MIMATLKVAIELKDFRKRPVMSVFRLGLLALSALLIFF
jgi:hypothetical protein